MRKPGLVNERPGRRNLLIDGRGRTVPLVEAADLPEGAPAMVIEAVRRAHLHRLWPQVRIFGITMGCCVAFVFVVNYFGVRVNPCLWWAIAFVVSGRAGAYGGRGKVYDNAVQAYTLTLAAGICPSCGYRIEGVPRGEDGLTVCPECAAAWVAGVSALPPAVSAGGVRRRPGSG